MVDFGVNRTQDTVPNLPQVSHINTGHAKPVPKPEGGSEFKQKAVEIKGVRQPSESSTAKKMLEKALEDVEVYNGEEVGTFDGSIDELNQAIEEMNVVADNLKSDVRFQYNEELGEFVVSVVNSETNEVERTIPPEYLIKLKIKLKEHVGQLLDKEI